MQVTKKENKEKIVEEDLSSLEVDDWIFKIGKQKFGSINMSATKIKLIIR